MKFSIFAFEKNLCILHGPVFVMWGWDPSVISYLAVARRCFCCGSIYSLVVILRTVCIQTRDVFFLLLNR